MSGHFSLDVDPDAVASAARNLTQFPEPLVRGGQRMSALAGALSAKWRGKAADSAEREVAALGRHTTSMAPHFERAGAALQRLAAVYAQATDSELPRLNARWASLQAEQMASLAAARRTFDLRMAGLALSRMPPDTLASQSRAHAVRLQQDRTASESALWRGQDTLESEYDALVYRLHSATRSAASAISAATVVRVSPLAAGVFGRAGALGRFVGNWLDPSGHDAYPDLALGAISGGLRRPPTDVDALAGLLDRARAAGYDPVDYGRALKNYWDSFALREAGIDGASWDPALGAEHNRATIEKVYRYYGDLYLRRPELEWAGMANMIGPSFAGGFLDLAMLRKLASRLDSLPPGARRHLPPGTGELSKMPEAEIRWYETKLLTMQKDIFFDQATMHAAYERGGIDAIDEMVAAVIIARPRIVEAWRDINRGRREGNSQLVRLGNTALLRREQYEVIADSYDQMREHGPTGPAVTWAMTLVGAPSIPGAKTYPQVFPLSVTKETPGSERLGIRELLDTISPFPLSPVVPPVGPSIDNPMQGSVTVTTPLPDGNISQRAQRWKLITQDTLPAYLHLLDQDPAGARQIIGLPVADRIAHSRLDETWDDTLRRLAEWEADIDQ